MAQIIDVRGSGGDLIIMGGALTLPTSVNAVATPIVGSIRYNIQSNLMEIYVGSSWTEITGAGGGVASFNTRTGAVTLTSADVVNALGYTPLFPPIPFSDLPASLSLLPIVYTQAG